MCLRPAIAALATALTLLAVSACQPAAESESPSGRAVVDSAIAAHGGAVLDHAVVTFDFRGDDVRIRQDSGRFRFQRTYTDSLGRTVREVLSNDSLYRTVDGARVTLSADERGSVETAVNSVSYFALLPHPLGDPAVQTTYEGRDTLDGTTYHRVRVTFEQEGGGRDWQDRFLYWFRADDTYAMDYLAYAYGFAPGEESGTRFREAYNVRRIEGVRVADYSNYTDTSLALDELHRYPDRFNQDALSLVSRVELDSVEVQPLRALGR
jgi:hypothetical protein